MPSPVPQYLQDILDTVRDQDGGETADYIEKLKNADPDKLGLALCTTDGHVYAVGDTDYEFSIQSISKPFVYALALDIYGAEEVHKYVGVEPSGEAFNELSLDSQGRPVNPLINAGAITVNQLIGGPNIPIEDRVEKIRDYLSRLAGRELRIDDEIFQSEMDGADRNMAIAHLLREAGKVTDSAHQAVTTYIKQCSVLVTVKDLAVMAATLANGGTQPITGEKILTAEACRVTQAVMVSAGMYDASGRWMVNVGIPAKSGVAGGLIGTIPSQMGVASLSPRLDKQGNSVRGVKVFKELSSGLGLNLMSSDYYIAPGIRRVKHKGNTTVVELQGRINFISAEKILHELVERNLVKGDLVLDVSGVTSFNKSGRKLIKDGLLHFREQGTHVAIYDPEGALPDYEFSDGSTAESVKDLEVSFTVPAARQRVFDAITKPRQWWEDRVEGEADEEGAGFTVESDDQKVALTVREADDGKRVVWHVEPTGDEKSDRDWDDTSLIFDIEEDAEGETTINFTHRGLLPHDEAYEEAEQTWRDRLRERLEPLIKRDEGEAEGPAVAAPPEATENS
ncbi:glutaminase [Corynebacterium sp. CNCTC7651]|uniref:glutaminase n=1 Tax=Corynebacterium sp. CNCTC7651 TaxID=2815361 RepID=UPI001F00C87F|nr:glutaminase [Corynebacterium sp. CNCTC7651]UIZ92188.1 glutaminase [Corynebacterium sp. CNCTC7651]